MNAIYRKTGGWAALMGIFLSLAAPAVAGLIQPVSLLNSNQTPPGGGNGDSFPVTLSTNGQFALVESSASDLVAGDTNKAAVIFIRNLAGGATLLVQQQRVSAANPGAT